MPYEKKSNTSPAFIFWSIFLHGAFVWGAYQIPQVREMIHEGGQEIEILGLDALDSTPSGSIQDKPVSEEISSPDLQAVQSAELPEKEEIIEEPETSNALASEAVIQDEEDMVAVVEDEVAVQEDLPAEPETVPAMALAENQIPDEAITPIDDQLDKESEPLPVSTEAPQKVAQQDPPETIAPDPKFDDEAEDELDTKETAMQEEPSQELEDQPQQLANVSPTVSPTPAQAAATTANSSEENLAPAASTAGLNGNTRSYTELQQRSGNVPPTYPERARRNRVEGQVQLAYYVTADGRVSQLRLLKSSGSSELDQESIEAVKKYRFYPGQAGWTQHQVNFVLRGPAKPTDTRLRTSSTNSPSSSRYN